MGMTDELDKKESYGTMKRRAEDIGYCGNVGCQEPASRQNTKEKVIVDLYVIRLVCNQRPDSQTDILSFILKLL